MKQAENIRLHRDLTTPHLNQTKHYMIIGWDISLIHC